MAYEREGETSVSQLISGIVGDAQVLVRQEIALARQEISEEISNAKQAGIKLGVAGGVLAVGGLLLYSRWRKVSRHSCTGRPGRVICWLGSYWRLSATSCFPQRRNN